jgi:predicted nucleic acid-binding protein
MSRNIEGPVLIDTSVWIDALRGKTQNVVADVRTLLEKDLAVTCGPVLMELRRGLRPEERKKVLPLFNAVRRIDFEEEDWEMAGDLDATLRNKGVTVPPVDMLIARVCLRHKLPIFTLDGHFRDIPGLKTL